MILPDEEKIAAEITKKQQNPGCTLYVCLNSGEVRIEVNRHNVAEDAEGMDEEWHNPQSAEKAR